MTVEDREIRIALVLYGGSSLAVYENGVTRCFFDLVKDEDTIGGIAHGRGVFAILRQFLNASATVDVVAGTSAGGINGLLLASALENGTEFALTADLWRKHGDFGRLLRRVEESEDAESLLDGEGYYQECLREAFAELCKRKPHFDYPKEMDVFVTSTDLDGAILTFNDGLGQTIRDKSHRVVFHLKHRAGRESLGLSLKDFQKDGGKLQSVLLASIARLTSSFPAAFPPFRLEQIDNQYRDDISNALSKCASRTINTENSFVDGGVLDNKPFERALRAIFYRMPGGVVERRLFYVEPDPALFDDSNPQPHRHTPLSVAASALFSIPAHESIYGDLTRLKEHNERVAWLSQIAKTVAHGIAADSDSDSSATLEKSLYRDTRIESLARALLVSDEGVPSANDQVDESPIFGSLRKSVSQLPFDNRDRLDADYHLRIAFRLLYLYSDMLRSDETRIPHCQTIVLLLGRIIKVIKLVRSMVVRLRKHIFDPEGDSQATSISGDTLIRHFHYFLSADREHWADLRRDFSLGPVVGSLTGQEFELFEKERMENVAKAARIAAVSDASATPPAEFLEATVLEGVAETTRAILEHYDTLEKDRYQNAEQFDERLYSLQFLSGIHELDIIRYVRVSPHDAQIGLSEGALEAKVTGEDFAHFSAFLRRDWRSNDILRGRIDGICQIVRSLLTADSFERARQYRVELELLFQPHELRRFLPHCPDSHLAELCEAWRDLASHWNTTAPTGADEKRALVPPESEFLRSLISAGQHDAFMEDIEGVSEDLYFQEIAWGRVGTPNDARSDSGLPSIEAKALELAKDHVARSDGDQKKLWSWFTQIASQKVVGSGGAVPVNILGEYTTNAYLLAWSMLERSLGPQRTKLNKFRLYLRGPVRLTYSLFRMLRQESRTAAVVTAAVIVTRVYGERDFLFPRPICMGDWCCNRICSYWSLDS